MTAFLLTDDAGASAGGWWLLAGALGGLLGHGLGDLEEPHAELEEGGVDEVSFLPSKDCPWIFLRGQPSISMDWRAPRMIDLRLLAGFWARAA